MERRDGLTTKTGLDQWLAWRAWLPGTSIPRLRLTVGKDLVEFPTRAAYEAMERVMIRERDRLLDLIERELHRQHESVSSWRDPGEAPENTRVLVNVENADWAVASLDGAVNRWVLEDGTVLGLGRVVGWYPLPALPGMKEGAK